MVYKNQWAVALGCNCGELRGIQSLICENKREQVQGLTHFAANVYGPMHLGFYCVTILFLNSLLESWWGILTIPVSSLSIRAVTIQSAVIIRPDPQDPTSTRMTLLFQTDFGGWLPKFIVNFFSAFAPPKWRREMYNFYTRVYSKEKNCRKVKIQHAHGIAKLGHIVMS